MVKQAIKKYFIFQEGNDILLVINAPVDDFDDEILKEIRDEARARGIHDAIEPDFKKYIASAERGEVLRIGGYSSDKAEHAGGWESVASGDGDAEPSDAIKIKIGKNNMSATLIINSDVVGVTEKLIRTVLEEHQIVYGINEHNLKTIVERYPEVKAVVIAEGDRPSDGRDAKIEILREIKTDLTPEKVEYGRADFKKLNLISPVHAGDVIKIRTPPSDDTPGMDIFGKALPGRKGKDVRLVSGINTKISDDGCELVAGEEGFLYLGVGGAVNVMAVYIVNGDVDYHTGNIEYTKDIIIRGDVRSGFHVKAGGCVHINGSVEDSEIHAVGRVQIDGGVRSSGAAIIKAGGDVKVNFIENTWVETPGNVLINREAVNCEIKAGGDIEVLWKQGRIIGGHISAGGWIIAPTLGSERSSLVELVMEPEGWEPHFKKLKKINAEITAICNDSSINDEERAVMLKQFVDKRVALSRILNEIFAYSFISAKSFLSPVNALFGYDVYKVGEDVGITTFSYRDLEIKHNKDFLDITRRDEMRKKRDAAKAESESKDDAEEIATAIAAQCDESSGE